MLRHLSIRKKLTVLTMVACVMSLVLGTGGLLLQEVQTFRETAVNELITQARILAGVSTATLSFHDNATATEMLSELKNRPPILLGVIYQQGRVFASYRRPDCALPIPAQQPSNDGYSLEGKQVRLASPIQLKGQRMGTIYLVADTGDFSKRMRQNVVTMLSVFLASAILALLLAGRMQQVIADPIQRLSTTASEIAATQNYALRAVKHGDDELGKLTDVFNQMLNRIEAQDAQLKESQERYELAVLGSSDGLWDFDLSRLLVYYSPRCKTMLGYDASHPLDDQAAWQALTHPDDAALMDRVFIDCWSGARNSFAVEFRARAADGEYRWVLVRGAVLRDAAGAVLRIAGSHTDITERKQLHQRLLETSRQAGMAEIATGVLHNVGNVLNSVNVSVTLVVDRMRQSKLANVSKAMALLEEHRSDLATFLTCDPRGQLVIDYLNSLIQHLRDEADANVSELVCLADNIDHIKQIVAMQQSYARVAGVMDSIPAESLLDDALRVVNTAFGHSGIQISREIAEAPPVFVDKHKVLQVLVNLLTNARQAIDEANPPERRVVVTIRPRGIGKVELTIRDNGTGIPPENLTRIFQHGFTTKAGGHGFGLHSGANALQEIGGSISVRSDGPGHGSAFTITLPTQAASSGGEPGAEAA